MENRFTSSFLSRLSEALSVCFLQPSTSLVQRISLYLPAPDIFSWLNAQTFSHKLFWSSRNRTTCIAGVGVADAFMPHRKNLHKHFADIQQKLGATPEARYFGGIRFAPEQQIAPEWQAFGSSTFFLPRFELHVESNRSTDAKFICNFITGKDSILGILEEAAKLCFDSLPLPHVDLIHLTQQNTPTSTQWNENIHHLLSQFKTNRLQKTVLARKAQFGFAQNLNPFQLLKNLYQTKPYCYHFLFQPEEDKAFLGASPERLYKRNGRSLWSEAVAGTRPRSIDVQEDMLLHDELLYSEKDRREQEFVHAFIRRALVDKCLSLKSAIEPIVLVLSRRMHLYTRISAQLKDTVCDADLIHGLHPTPAVCGEPKEASMEVLSALETFDRGWYAGLVGWISGEGAEFAVAIRSGLCEGNTLSLYSGAGIVAGSVAKEEWAEIEGKISDFLESEVRMGAFSV